MFFLCLVWVSAASLRAQPVNLADSLRGVLQYKPQLLLRFDTRHSFVTGRSAKIWGIKAGLNWRKTLSAGVGYNWLQTEFTEPYEHDHALFEGRLRFRYVAPFIEYTFFRRGPWEATVPVQAGMGISFVKGDRGEKFKRGRIMLYEPAMTIEYKIFNLIGVGGGLGYRLMLVNNREISQRFTSPVYLVRARLILDGLMPKN